MKMINIFQMNYSKQKLQELWEQFADVPINNNDEIDEDFNNWKKGTDRFEIWHWFDEHYPGGVQLLVYP